MNKINKLIFLALALFSSGLLPSDMPINMPLDILDISFQENISPNKFADISINIDKVPYTVPTEEFNCHSNFQAGDFYSQDYYQDYYAGDDLEGSNISSTDLNFNNFVEDNIEDQSTKKFNDNIYGISSLFLDDQINKPNQPNLLSNNMLNDSEPIKDNISPADIKNKILERLNLEKQDRYNNSNYCIICQIKFFNWQEYKEHSEKHKQKITENGVTKKLYKCLIENCGMQFSSTHLIRKHMINKHNAKSPYSCESCAINFLYQSAFLTHLIEVHEKTFKCTKLNCGAVFKERYELALHSDSVHRGGNRCPICQHLLSSKNSLNKHLKIHKEVDSIEKNENNLLLTDPKAMQIDQLDQAEKMRQIGQIDQQDKFDEDMQASKINQVNQKDQTSLMPKENSLDKDCEIEKIAREDQVLQTDQLEQINKIDQADNPKSDSILSSELSPKTTPKYLYKYIKGVKQFFCTFPKCSKAFTEYPNMLRHVATVHNNKCTFPGCGKMFKTKHKLKIHKKTHNWNIYECPFENCYKTFYQKGTLNSHIRIHKGELFMCDNCSRPFNDKHNLERHKKSKYACENYLKKLNKVSDTLDSYDSDASY